MNSGIFVRSFALATLYIVSLDDLHTLFRGVRVEICTSVDVKLFYDYDEHVGWVRSVLVLSLLT